MTELLVNVDRDTPMLLPADLREWVPEDDLVHFVIAVVDSMNLPSTGINRRGSGSEQYPPRMMLALLICVVGYKSTDEIRCCALHR